ncbi:hypothetical protein FQZ97_1132220 [compost metagenome]
MRRLGEAVDDVADLVAGGVIADDDLDPFVSLGERTLQRLTEKARVKGRDDDTDEGTFIHDGKLSSGGPPPIQAEAPELLNNRRLAARQTQTQTLLNKPS